MDLQRSSASTTVSSPVNIGAAVSIPLALFFLLVFVCLFYRRNPFLYTRHRDAFFYASRWTLALVTCQLSSIQQESSIIRPKSRSSFMRLENDLPHSDSDSSDSDVLSPTPLGSDAKHAPISAPAPASSPSRTAHGPPHFDDSQQLPKSVSGVLRHSR
jgi:hypothetical protein